jgi:hypothetical protein
MSYTNLAKQSSDHRISVLIGSRQVGKTTLLGMLQDRLGLPFDLYNLENPLHLNLFNEGYTSFIRQVRSKLLFIDEFQYCPNISSIFKAIYDLHPDIKIYASGSSSLEIQAHLKESLAGRKLETTLYPLSFQEWIWGIDSTLHLNPNLDEPSHIDELATYNKLLPDFMRFGALPALLSFPDELTKREYLLEIYKTYIAKDIKSFLKEESILSFNKMISWLALNNGSLLNKHNLSGITNISARQIDRYLEILQGTYVLALVPPFFTNKVKELVKTNKFYLYDQGVLNTIIQDFRPLELRPDAGIIRETFVFWELKKHADIRYNISYWRTVEGKEVDFILEKDRSLLPIEVKSGWKTGKVPPGLAAFFRYYPEVKDGVVLYDGPEQICQDGAHTIHFAPLWKAASCFSLLP